MSKNIGAVSEPTITDLLNAHKRDIFNTLNCVQVGTIQHYNSATNMAKVSVNFKRQFQDGAELDYPLLCDCPVFILSGGAASVSMPIASGDQCLILFNDRNIDNWYLDGSVKAPRNSRAHSISDAIVLVGIRNLSTASLTPANSICLNGGAKKIAIKNNAQDLKTLLLALLDAIIALTVTSPPTGGVTSPPINSATFTALKLQFAALLDEGIS